MFGPAKNVAMVLSISSYFMDFSFLFFILYQTQIKIPHALVKSHL